MTTLFAVFFRTTSEFQVQCHVTKKITEFLFRSSALSRIHKPGEKKEKYKFPARWKNCQKDRSISRGGAVVGALASHQCGLGSIPARYHMWVEFVVGSRPCSEGFPPGSPVFLPPQKPTL